MLRYACLILLVFAGVAAADVQTGVVRSSGQPIPGATVSAECGTDAKITTTTDDAGRFEIGGLPSTSCKYTVLMFAFEPIQKDASASSTPLSFDLTLQGHPTMPVAPKAAAPVTTTVAPAAPAPAAVTPEAPAPTPDLPKPSMAAAAAAANAPQGGRGGRGARGASGARGATTPAVAANGRAGGRGATTAQNGRGGNTGGFQTLGLVQNGDAPAASDAPIASLGGGDNAGVSASDSFTVSGTLSQGVQAQAGDGFGMGGPGGFGFGAGGPGGDPFGGGAGLGGDGAGGDAVGGRGGRGGAGGPGGRGGAGAAGFAGAGGGGRGGGGAGGGRGGGGGGGGRGGPGGPGGRGGRAGNGVTAFGNRAGRGRGPQWQFSLNYNFTNSALNARPYSVASATTSGLAPAKPATATNQGGFTLGGPIMIPKTRINLPRSRWNLNVTGSRNRVGIENVSSVPIPAFRTGDFSSLLGSASPIQIYDPLTNQPFAGNLIPQSRFSPAAVGLLSFYPSPTGVGLVKNYEFDASNPSNSNTVTATITEPVTTKDRLNINISAQSRNSASIQTFGYRDPTSGGGKSFQVSYSRTLRPTLVNTFTASVNRNVTNNLSFFSNGVNIAALYGINGVLATPATYGPPTLSFQGGSGLAGLSDAVPSTNHSTTFSLSESISKTKARHTIAFGISVSKRESNSLTASNARGTFSFTGASTAGQAADGSGAIKNTGYDLADFLLGLPAQTSLTNYLNGNDMFYYRQHNMAAYVNDDFRATTRLTINAGLRWEFYAPQTEKYDHMANIEFSPAGTSAHIVTPGQQYAYSNGLVPDGLIAPYYKMLEPQIGFAFKPWAKRSILFRGGYGIRYNGASIGSLGNRLTIQPPFVQTYTLTPSQALAQTGKVITLQNGFPVLPNGTITNNYSVSPDYKPGMAQQWNAMVQYTFARSYVIQGTYSGAKGSALDVLLAPNRATPGAVATEASRAPIQNVLTTIQFDESVGTSISHSGQAQISRRLAKGFGSMVTYTLAKTLSDSSILGSGVVQIENNLLAERGVTTDPHQNLAVTFNYQSLATNQKSDFYWKLVRGWQLNGAYDLSSGSPFTATVAGDPSGTGVIGSTRADATGLSVTGGNCATCQYFNTAAFALVPNGTYGTAGRNTIPGIVNFTLRASAMRSFRLGERHRLSLTFTANNPLNHVAITGVGTQVGTNTYGLATRAGGMRTVTAQARFTF